MTEIFILATKRLTLSKVVLTGNQISPTGKFTLSLEHLREKAHSLTHYAAIKDNRSVKNTATRMKNSSLPSCENLKICEH